MLRCLFTPPSGRFLHHSRVDLWRPAGPSSHSQITWFFRVFMHSERAIRQIRRALFLEHKHVILALRFGWRKSFSLNVSFFITLLLHSYNARTGQMIPSVKFYYEFYSDIQDQPLIKYILPVEQLKWYIWHIHAGMDLERFWFSFQLVSDDDELSCLIKECLEKKKQTPPTGPTEGHNQVIRFTVFFCFFFSFLKRHKKTDREENKSRGHWPDSVISILLHFIMPLSIISTDYMQLDLLYSFLLSAWTDTRRFRLQIHRYMCVFLYSMKERAVTGVTWLPGVEGQRPGPPPSPCPRLFLGSHFQIRRNRTKKTKDKEE